MGKKSIWKVLFYIIKLVNVLFLGVIDKMSFLSYKVMNYFIKVKFFLVIFKIEFYEE